MLILVALLASFCGILQQLTRILLGTPQDRADQRRRAAGRRAGDGACCWAALLVFSVWLPAPLLELLHQAAAIIGGKP